MGNWIMFVILMINALIFLIMGVVALRLKKPMHFWAGSVVKPEEITDIPAYNRANGIMWISFGGVCTIVSFLSFYNVLLAGLAIVVVVLAGLPMLILAYGRIYDRYQS